MEHKPADVIRQAREKAENALLHQIESEITRICNAFTYDTGLNVYKVQFGFISTNKIGGAKEQALSGIDIDHEDA